MLSSKTIGNADPEHLGELTQIPTSEYSTHTQPAVAGLELNVFSITIAHVQGQVGL